MDDCPNIEACFRTDPWAAAICGPVWGKLCEKTPQAGGGASNGDSAGPPAPIQPATGQLAAIQEVPAAGDMGHTAIGSAPPYSEPQCADCDTRAVPCFCCPRRAAQHGNLELARE